MIKIDGEEIDGIKICDFPSLNQLPQGHHLIFKPTFGERHVLKPIPKKK